MTAPPILSADVSESLASLWTRYAGRRPTSSRTEIRGNVVTCVLVDAVDDFNRGMIASYEREAVAAIVGLTRQRVASFVSSHDRDTDVATEVFTLEPSLARGAPRRAP